MNHSPQAELAATQAMSEVLLRRGYFIDGVTGWYINKNFSDDMVAYNPNTLEWKHYLGQEQYAGRTAAELDKHLGAV